MNRFISLLFVAALIMGCNSADKTGGKINRQQLVSRHNPQLTAIAPTSALTVGNGSFAFTADITGLQTFPEAYKCGVCLTTQADWGWYSEPNFLNSSIASVVDKAGYAVPGKSGIDKDRSDYFAMNQHRFNLAQIGFAALEQSALGDALQTLDLYDGILNSEFKYNGKTVKVTTACDAASDMLAVAVNSEELLPVSVAFPYPSMDAEGDGADWTMSGCTTELVSEKNCAIVRVKNHIERYNVRICLDNAYIRQPGYNSYEIVPLGKSWSFTAEFSRDAMKFVMNSADNAIKSAKASWNSFWQTSGAVDFSKCTDERASELERRIVLSQYLTAAQCAGCTPASTRGLSGNTNYGKFRLDEYWWTEAQFALWGHADKAAASFEWFASNLDNAKNIAKRQGYDGARWPSVSSMNGGETPSDSDNYTAAYEAQIIYLSELVRRYGNIDEKYNAALESTVEFLGSFPIGGNERYDIVCQPLQSNLPVNTVNPAYEIAAWRYAIKAGANIKKSLRCALVSRDLAKIPVYDGLYAPAEGIADAYDSKYTNGHPTVLGMVGMLPADEQIDMEIMSKTFDKVVETWDWDSCCGYDYAMAAMCATRLGKPEKAIELLMMDAASNRWLANGHNMQKDMSCCYLPGNGALLAAVALMTAGWEGAESEAPGFPKDGKWNVTWEGINALP